MQQRLKLRLSIQIRVTQPGKIWEAMTSIQSFSADCFQFPDRNPTSEICAYLVSESTQDLQTVSTRSDGHMITNRDRSHDYFELYD